MTMSRRTLLAGGLGAAAPRSRIQIDAAPKLSGVSAGLVTDALREIGLDPRSQVMSTDIRPVVSTHEIVSGPAVTTKWELAREPMEPGAIRRFVFQPVDKAPTGSVWVVASGTDELLSMFGDLIGLACERNGLAGAVTDSGCRDVSSMQGFGFPVFAKGRVLYGPGAVIRPVAANVPVTCGGVEVAPSDWVVADADGVVVVPRARLDSLVDAVRELEVKENEVRRKIEAGMALADAYDL